MSFQFQKSCEIIEAENYTAIKYADGRSEFIYECAVTDLNINTPVGSAYYGMAQCGSFPNGLFISKPKVNVTFVADDTNGAAVYGVRNVSNTSAGNVPLVRVEQGVVNGYLSYFAYGFWK